MLQRTFLRLGDLRGLAGGQYVRIAAGILASPALARGLGAEGRGVWALIMLYDIATTLVLSRGVPNAFGFTYLGELEDADTRAAPRSSFEYANWAVHRTAVVSVLIGSVIVAVIFLTDQATSPLVALAVLTMTTPLAMIRLCARQYSAVSHQDRWVLIIDAVPAMLQAALFVLLFIVDSLTVATALCAVVAVRAFAAALALRIWPRTKRQRPPDEFSRYGWRALPTAVGQLAQGRVEQLAILSIGTSAVGIFAVGGVIASLPTPLYRATGQQLFRVDDLTTRAWHRARQQTAVAWMIAVVAGIAGLWLVPFVYGSEYEEAGVVALILTIGSLGDGVFVLCRGWMDRVGKPGRSSAIALVHVVLVALIVPVVAATIGLYAAAVASAGLVFVRGAMSLYVRGRLEP